MVRMEKKNAFHLVIAPWCKSAYSAALPYRFFSFRETPPPRLGRGALPSPERKEGKEEDVAGQYEAVRADTGIFRRREGKVCGEIRIQ